MDRLTTLTVFARVVECGGFSAAARKLNMSVTMVSNHVQSLEDRLGARLLNRTTRKTSLTDIGKDYYERASQILADLDDADRVASAAQASPRGKLRLYATPAIARFLAPVIKEFLERHELVTVDFDVGDRMVDLIEEGFDLAIRPIPPPDSSLIVRKLTTWRHILCCAPSYLTRRPPPSRPEELKDHNCLRYQFYPFGDEWRFRDPAGHPVRVRVGGDLVTNSAEALRLLALGGHGVFLGPSFVVADDIAAGTLSGLLPHFPPEEFSINAIYPHRAHLSTKVRLFIDLLADRFEAHRKWMDPRASHPSAS